MKKLNLNENFICRIWEDKSCYAGLKAISGEIVEVIDTGIRNYDSGPDYKDAKIRINGNLFAGAVEIHRSPKDWYSHNHKGDDKYNDVILQAVLFRDEDDLIPVVRRVRKIPTVVLSEFLTKPLKEIWKEIINNPSPDFKLPCFPKNKSVPPQVKNEFLNTLGMDRLDYKTKRINERLSEITDDISSRYSWEQILLEYIFEALGYSKNKKQFLKLAKNIPFAKIRKSGLDRENIDSMLFGQAGFLKDLKFKDEYIDKLKSDWHRCREIFKPEVMDKSEWNFFRLRPVNFPTLRLAYASGILNGIINEGLLKKIAGIFVEDTEPVNGLEEFFRNIQISGYWLHHYNFGKNSRRKSDIIGKQRITDIISNVILPFIKLYAQKFGKISLERKADYIFKKSKVKSKGNEITKVMENQIFRKVLTVSDEQSLIQLHNFYCMKGRCRECEIGKIVFENNSEIHPLKIILY